ncbi:hypothetical protein [Phyllobacterium brassicacearum]|uniref:hypothetical protein n=1 Tax=Phyllobacterium brassicacearum TaxID=314235 RepID=UPI001414D79B|nr:hypothetical protein [Phyllobacterium brassicacearum]
MARRLKVGNERGLRAAVKHIRWDSLGVQATSDAFTTGGARPPFTAPRQLDGKQAG